MQIGPEASLSSASASASASTWLRLGFVCGFLVAAKISVTAERRFVEKLWTVVAAAKHNNKFGILHGREGPRAGRQTGSKQEATALRYGWVGSTSPSSSAAVLLRPCIMMCNIWQKEIAQH